MVKKKKKSLSLGDLLWINLHFDTSYKNSQIPKASVTRSQPSVPAFKDIKEADSNQQKVKEKQAKWNEKQEA